VSANLAKLALNDREFVRRLIDELRLATYTSTVADLTITAHQAEILHTMIKLADAVSCRHSALTDAGLHEIAGYAEQIAKVMP
jgi:hypothetical protein